MFQVIQVITDDSFGILIMTGIDHDIYPNDEKYIHLIMNHDETMYDIFVHLKNEKNRMFRELRMNTLLLMRHYINTRDEVLILYLKNIFDVLIMKLIFGIVIALLLTDFSLI